MYATARVFSIAKHPSLAWILVVLISVTFPLKSPGQTTVTLEWSPSTDPAVVGFHIYYGAASGTYTNLVVAGNETKVIIHNLLPGTTYYFVATAYDESGVESGYSNEVSFRVPSPPNPFPEAAGTYNGLFYEPEQVEQATSGYFALFVTTRGTYSGRLQIAARRHPITGRFDDFGQMVKLVHRTGALPFTVNLRVGSGGARELVSGEISDGTWTANLSAPRTSFDARRYPAPFAGFYTMLVIGRHKDPSIPGGASFGIVRVGRNGLATFAGSFADGSKATQSAWISNEGFWPVYVPLYSGNGSLLSWLKFTRENHADFRGLVSWIRPANTGAPFYSAGFTNDCFALGSSYERPSATSPYILGLQDARISFTGGDLSWPFTNSITIDRGNRILNHYGTPLILSFSASSGTFTGRVNDPATGKPLSFRGAVFQRLKAAYGFLLTRDQSSLVTLEQ